MRDLQPKTSPTTVVLGDLILRCAPQRVIAAHRTNQGSYVLRDCRSPQLFPSNPPRPEQAEALAMPTDHRRRLHDGGTRLPILPDRRHRAHRRPSASAASPSVSELRVDDGGPESDHSGRRNSICSQKERSRLYRGLPDAVRRKRVGAQMYNACDKPSACRASCRCTIEIE